MVSSYRVSSYLKGIDYPAGKQDLINQASTNNAPDDVVDALSRIPDKTYSTMPDVWHEIGETS